MSRGERSAVTHGFGLEEQKRKTLAFASFNIYNILKE